VLVEELGRIETANNDPSRRRLEALRAAVAQAERDAQRSATTLAQGAANPAGGGIAKTLPEAAATLRRERPD